MIKAIIIDAGGVLFQNYAGEGQLNEALLKLLESYKPTMKLGVISSTSYDLKDILDKSDLIPFFDLVMTTGETGLDKARPEIYAKAAKILGLPESEIIFIDNESQYIEAAAEAGMKTIYYSDFESCKEQLLKILVKENSC